MDFHYDEDLSATDYILIFSRVDLHDIMNIDINCNINNSLKMRYLANNPTCLEYRTFFSLYCASSLEDKKGKPDFCLINNLLLDSRKDAEDLLHLYAYTNGFKLIQNNGNKSYIKFHCWKGGRVKGHNTNKCNCPFKVNISIRNDGKACIKLKEPNHNHDI